MRIKLNCLRGMNLLILSLAGKLLVAQTPEHCVTQGQLQEIQQRSVDDTRMFLSHIGWYYQGQNSDHGWVHESEVLAYHQSVWTNSAGPGGRLEVFHYPGKPNIVVLHTDEVCNGKIQGQLGTLTGTELQAAEQTLRLGSLHWRFNTDIYSGYTRQIEITNKAALNKDAAAIKQRVAAERAAEIAEERAYREKVREAELAKASGQYSKAITHYREAIALRDDGSLWEPVRYCERMVCLNKEVRADSAFRALNYQLALELYRLAVGCSANPENIRTKIRHMESKVKERQVLDKVKEADQFLLEKRYAPAMERYKEVLTIDPNHRHASNKVQEIRNIYDLLLKRAKTTYPYSSWQPEAWTHWKTRLADVLESNTSQYPAGYINASLELRFDTAGRNKSKCQLLAFSQSGFDAILNNHLRSKELPPVKDRGYFMNAAENLNLQFEWKTQPIHLRVSGNGEVQSDDKIASGMILANYLRNQQAAPGIYQFVSREKQLNGKTFTDLSLLAYENRHTAGGIWRSLLLPGTGSGWLSYGEKGAGSRRAYLSFALVSLGGFVVARSAENQADLATGSAEREELEARAGVARTIAFSGGAIAFSISAGELFRTLQLGKKNDANRAYWDEKLLAQPFFIQRQAVALP